MSTNTVEQSDLEKERRLALVLADGTGDFDFVHLATYEGTVFVKGTVPTYERKMRADQLAHYVGFENIVNALRVANPEI